MDTYNIFTTVALVTFLTLFIVWTVRYNNLKKKCNSSGGLIDITINNLNVNNQDVNISDANILYVSTLQLALTSTYSGDMTNVFAHFKSSNEEVAVYSKGIVEPDDDPGYYNVELKIAQIDGGVGITSSNIYVVFHNIVTNETSEQFLLEVGPIQCIYEKTKISTKDGLKCAEDVVVGDEILQPCGKTSKVQKITQTLISQHLGNTSNEVIDNSKRLYQFKNTIVTYWHKIMLGDEMVLPKDHPDFQELMDSDLIGKANVYNFLLDDYDDLIITEDLVILESLKPYFDEHGIEHKPWKE